MSLVSSGTTVENVVVDVACDDCDFDGEAEVLADYELQAYSWTCPVCLTQHDNVVWDMDVYGDEYVGEWL